MELKLEELEYQKEAIQSVIDVFDGTAKNTFDNASDEGIRFNLLTLNPEQIQDNIKKIVAENGIADSKAKLSEEKDLSIEMETGTGKTLVYIKTIYELHKHYGFTKFIVLVPSIAIRQGVLGTLKTFEKQLNEIYGFTPKYFEYDSKKLNEVKSFADEQHPQIMIMTTAAIVGDDKVINREEREGLFDNMAFIEVIGKTNPIVIMDEPQEGMDAVKTKEAIDKLNPLVKIRYSATHKEIKNLIYRLTPYESYSLNLVKKIRLFTVTEKNDEATMKLELADVQASASDPKVKLKAWKIVGGKHVWGETNWLKKGDNLGDKTGNSSYNLYTIGDIQKPLMTRKWQVKFTNGAEISEGQTSANIESIWELQLDWLIRCHFEKKKQLEQHNIKCLSLIFIDRVSNYMDSENPKIKNLFIEKYKELYPQYNEGTPTAEHIESVQGYYFAKTNNGEFTDNEKSMAKNKEIFKLILEKKEELLSIDNPVQFIFSHSALGVGWDNPNVFNIATLNNSNNEDRKRQEIGRGLRICVNQSGTRVYDSPTVKDEDRINQLTVFPNETGETFIETYQSEIREIYGTSEEGAVITVTHKGKPKNKVTFKLNKDEKIQKSFKAFWDKMARKTNYVVSFNEDSLVENCIKALKEISIARYIAQVSARTIDELKENEVVDTFLGSQDYELKARFTPLDLIEEISENTQLSYPTIFRIVDGLKDKSEMIKNPPLFIHLAVNRIKQIELDEMLRGIQYHLTGESLPFEFADYEKEVAEDKIAETPKRGIFDKMIVDSTTVEKPFAENADRKDEVVCFLKLPKYYAIKTPIGTYEPDFGVVLCRKQLLNGQEDEYYFVVETKGTNDLNDVKALKESEIYKIKCAMKHFEALGLKDFYKAPIKEYDYFSAEADKTIKNLVATN
jgi:type III restriction enzyme